MNSKLPELITDNLYLEILHERGFDIGYTIIWKPSDIHKPRPVGEVICSYDENRMRYDIVYMKIATDYQNKGVGSFALSEIKSLIPAEAHYVGFISITSQGTARLVEKVFGPLLKLEYHAEEQESVLADFSNQPENSPGRLLLYARGPSACVEWTGLNKIMKPQ